jgi:Archaeal Type IV pilin, N-terminal
LVKVIKMKNILKNRKALSTVVTTLIILVVSVLLAGVVTYFAINVTSTRVQEESLQLMKQHVWHNTTMAQAALMITNTGGRDVVIDKIAVRGQDCPWTNVWYQVTSTAPSTDFTFNSTIANAVVSPTVGYKNTTTNIVLPSGQTLLIYINNPDSIAVNDIGLTVAISVFSAQAIYYKETNIQAAV